MRLRLHFQTFFLEFPASFRLHDSWEFDEGIPAANVEANPGNRVRSSLSLPLVLWSSGLLVSRPHYPKNGLLLIPK